MKCKLDINGECRNGRCPGFLFKCKIPCDYIVPMTNADRIRDMVATDEGIAKILLALDIYLAEDGREFTHLYCDGKNNCITEDDDIICTDEMRTACILRWLQQPAKEE